MRLDNNHNRIYHQIPFKTEALCEISVSLSNSHLTAEGTCRDHDPRTTVLKEKKKKKSEKKKQMKMASHVPSSTGWRKVQTLPPSATI